MNLKHYLLIVGATVSALAMAMIATWPPGTAFDAAMFEVAGAAAVGMFTAFVLCL